MTDKETKVKKSNIHEWADIELMAQGPTKLITQVYTTAKDAPEIFRGWQGNAKVYPAEKNYLVFHDGSRLDLD